MFFPLFFRTLAAGKLRDIRFVLAAAGHDGLWYLQQARDYKSKGQTHNAWFYYLNSYDLLQPATFMNTKMLSKITDETNSIQPKDIPVGASRWRLPPAARPTTSPR